MVKGPFGGFRVGGSSRVGDYHVRFIEVGKDLVCFQPNALVGHFGWYAVPAKQKDPDLAIEQTNIQVDSQHYGFGIKFRIIAKISCLIHIYNVVIDALFGPPVFIHVKFPNG